MSAENTVQRSIWLALGRVSRLFRLNTGKAWLSSMGPAGVHRLEDGSIHIKAPRPIAIGLGYPNGDPVTGASDLVGWTTVVITPEMVGRRVAVFTAIETKRTKGGRASQDQLDFVDQVKKAGGMAGIANGELLAQSIVDEWKHPNA